VSAPYNPAGPYDPAGQLDDQPVPSPIPADQDASAIQPYASQQVAVDPVAGWAPSRGKTRSPFGVWGLSIITLGIYYLVWWYKINSELRDYHNSIQVSPGLATFAVVVPIASWVTTFTTGSRIGQAQILRGLGSNCSGGLGILAAICFGLNTVYYQGQLNRLWAQRRSDLS
jgi:hypothetical protein